MIHAPVLEALWRGVAAHLWQTTLVLVALALIARVLRNAPARFQNALWWIGFAKIFMPLALLGRAGALLAGLASGTVLGGRVQYILDPGILVTAYHGGGGARAGFFTAISVAWAAGAVCILLRRNLRSRASRSPAAGPLSVSPEHIRGRVSEAARGVGVSPGNIVLSKGGGVPAVTGLLRPKIILPESAATDLDRDELGAVMLHEDEHRRRHEPLRLAFQNLALAVFFFYPPLWLLLRKLNSSAEMACDEAVIDAGTAVDIYRAAIARVIGLGAQGGLAAALLGFGGQSFMTARFDRIENKGRYKPMRRHHIAIVTAVLTVMLLSFIPVSPLAESHISPPVPAPPVPPAPPEVSDVAPTPPELVADRAVLPVYPRRAEKDGIEGKVVLKVFVGKDGKVNKVEVVEGIPGYPEMAESATEAVSQWTFVPAMVGDKPLESSVIIPVAFRLDDSKAPDAD
jgi:TonB family protein